MNPMQNAPRKRLFILSKLVIPNKQIKQVQLHESWYYFVLSRFLVAEEWSQFRPFLVSHVGWLVTLGLPLPI